MKTATLLILVLFAYISCVHGASQSDTGGAGLSVEQARRWRSSIRSALFVPDPLPQLDAVNHGRFEPVKEVIAERISFATQFEMRVPAIVYSPKELNRDLPALIIVMICLIGCHILN